VGEHGGEGDELLLANANIARVSLREVCDLPAIKHSVDCECAIGKAAGAKRVTNLGGDRVAEEDVGRVLGKEAGVAGALGNG
jgi:hypothetical protein